MRHQLMDFSIPANSIFITATKMLRPDKRLTTSFEVAQSLPQALYAALILADICCDICRKIFINEQSPRNYLMPGKHYFKSVLLFSAAAALFMPCGWAAEHNPPPPQNP